MPWGLPASPYQLRGSDDEVWSFRCPACRAELFRYSPHCPECGAAHPSERRAFGTTGRRYRRVWRPAEVVVELGRLRGWTAEVGTFRTSHCELAIDLWSDAGGTTLVYCASVSRIELAPARWTADLRVESTDDVFTLLDDAARLRVVCNMLGVYVPERDLSASGA